MVLLCSIIYGQPWIATHTYTVVWSVWVLHILYTTVGVLHTAVYNYDYVMNMHLQEKHRLDGKTYHNRQKLPISLHVM